MRAGLLRHADLWAVRGLSTEFWKSGFWRGLQPEGVVWADAEACSTAFLGGLFQQMDPNALLAMGWKWQRGDVARNTGGDLAAALGRITAKTLVMPIDTDMFFPVADCAAEAALTPGAELRVLPSIAGHFGLFGFEQSYLDALDRALAELLAFEP